MVYGWPPDLANRYLNFRGKVKFRIQFSTSKNARKMSCPFILYSIPGKVAKSKIKWGVYFKGSVLK